MGGFTLVLLAIAGASREDDEGASFVAGAVLGRILACVAIAYGLRFLWLRVIRRDKESELKSPWIAVIAAILAALSLAGSAGGQ